MYSKIIAMTALLLACCLTALAQQDTAKAKPDTSAARKTAVDTISQKQKPPAIKPQAKYQIDTSFEALNLERMYYGMDGVEGTYDYNPWDDYLYQEGEGREAAEQEQRDQERDSRE